MSCNNHELLIIQIMGFLNLYHIASLPEVLSDRPYFNFIAKSLRCVNFPVSMQKMLAVRTR